MPLSYVGAFGPSRYKAWIGSDLHESHPKPNFVLAFYIHFRTRGNGKGDSIRYLVRYVAQWAKIWKRNAIKKETILKKALIYLWDFFFKWIGKGRKGWRKHFKKRFRIRLIIHTFLLRYFSIYFKASMCSLASYILLGRYWCSWNPVR